MSPVSRDEVNHRGRILDVHRKIGPALIGLEVGEAGIVVELRAGLVERRDARLTTAGNVQHREVKRQAQQITAHVRYDEFVHRVANITRQPTDDIGVDFF